MVIEQISQASELFEVFTGHNATWCEDRHEIKSGVYLKIGYCDFLGLIINKKSYELKFKKRECELLIKSNGLSFALIGKDLVPSHLAKIKGVVNINFIGYTTKRDGVIEKYLHDFKPKARPQLKILTRQYILSLGGAFDFTERGFVDR